jgi:transcription initiation factor TFIIIB Brf1 subunit/transcription initiation factor TFIIB
LETGENFRTENRAGLRTFSVYQSCKEHKYPITEEAVARMFNFSKKTISNGHKIGRDIYNALEEQMNKYEAPLSLSAYINKFCHMLNFDAEYTKICLFILKKVEKSGIMRDNTDISIVSGIIYFVAIVFNMPIKKTEIYTTCNTSDVTINKCFKKLQQHQDELISQTMLAKYRIV